ncbi:ABC-F family ATP-binding cassette domain-containing protein [Halosquirtibacter laminarini]|uniref:ABC-F family ATP-binding cassette domain-containing protein n=1 Tax=Halosquirtibacter laminarini TaxID=3374600 RepID=A0AC61NCL6_9BACT|nr:ABC-F family ATP-binding cassette domain-containing protein [Prolixibacteraceae bacterium]
MISVEQLTVSFGGFDLFKNITFKINPKDRIGLTGRNGAGKSTMLKVFAKQQEASSGEVICPKDVTVGYLPQHMMINDNRTVLEEAESAFEEILILENELKQLNESLAVREDYESESYMDLIHKVTDLTDRLQIIGAGNYMASIEQTLIGLGFKRDDFQRQTSEFSGGWRMRIELAKILLRRPDVFLLDEPTNHLDIESIQWLENFLKDYHGAVVLVSHDRAFLDNITNRTIEISMSSIHDYKANYSQYLVLRKERRQQLEAAYENQQKMIKDTEDFIERFRYKATKAVQVQSRIKQLDKVERIELDVEDKRSLNIKFPPAPRSGTIVVDAKEASKSYDHLVLDKVDLEIERGQKIAFVGKNGEGKSTMVKMIMQEIAFDGAVNLGHNVKIGYFAQNQASLLDETLTVFETIDNIAVGDMRTKVRDILGAFMFSGEDVDKKVKVLSGGERSRLAMIKLLLEPVNLLILDEPTNHLDISSKELLKQAIVDFEGTVIVVSHDREFLDGLVSDVVEFRDKKLRHHNDGIYGYLAMRQKELAAESVLLKQIVATKKSESENGSDEGTTSLSYAEKKEINKKISKAERDLQRAENNIERLESEIEKMDDEVEKDPSKGTDMEFFKRYDALKNDLDVEMETWEDCSEKLDSVLTLRTW